MTSRQEIFSRADLQKFRERQMADMEQRTFKTMSDHASTYGNRGAPSLEMQLGDTFTNIKFFAEQQVDKMKRMGVNDEQIRLAVIGSIQKATMGLASGHKVKATFDNLLENLNREVEHYIQHNMDPRHATQVKLA